MSEIKNENTLSSLFEEYLIAQEEDNHLSPELKPVISTHFNQFFDALKLHIMSSIEYKNSDQMFDAAYIVLISLLAGHYTPLDKEQFINLINVFSPSKIIHTYNEIRNNPDIGMDTHKVMPILVTIPETEEELAVTAGALMKFLYNSMNQEEPTIH